MGAGGQRTPLSDRLHHATRKAGFPTILAEVHAGTRRDAMLYGFGANVRHGLRETRADKRRKIEAMLRDPEWVMWSDREIGRRCGVRHETVAAVRSELVEGGEIRHVDTRTDSIGRQQPASKTDQTAAGRGEIRHVDTYSEIVASGEIPQIDAEPIAAPAPAPVSASVPLSAAAPTPAADGEVERLRVENDELREHLTELAKNLEDAIAENEILQRITEADDQVQAALAEVRRVSEINRILEERIRGLTNEKAEAIRMAKSWQRKAERAEKQIASEVPA